MSSKEVLDHIDQKVNEEMYKSTYERIHNQAVTIDADKLAKAVKEDKSL